MKRLLIIAVFTLCWTQVSAQTLYVPSGEYSSIQSAINGAGDGDTIVVSAGTYRENINFLGKAVTLRSADPNDPNIVAGTIIDGNAPADINFGSVVTFSSGEDANSVLSGFTIIGGTGSWLPVAWQLHQVYWNRCGGGVVCYNMSEPTIIKNVFSNNIAGEGGGIYIYGNPVDPNNPSNPPVHVKPVITDNTFVNNSAIIAHGFNPPNEAYPAAEHGDGGAIVCFQGVDAIIKANLIQNNHADNYGGGIHQRQWSNSLIEDNNIIANNSLLGGGVHITYTSSPTVRDNLIQANTTANITGDLGGGGVYVYYNSNPLIERNLITQNQSSNGSGILIAWTSNPTIRDNMIVKNEKSAGIRVKGGSIPIITNNTIVGNKAGKVYAGGVDCMTDSAPIIENNIIASNGRSFGIYAWPTPPVIRYNDVWDNKAGNYSSLVGDQTGINGNISIDPNFVNPGYWDSNGTPGDPNDDFFVAGNYHLLPISPCRNAGDPNYTPQPSETDYDEEERIFDTIVDMGADEVVTNPVDLDNDGIVDYSELAVLATEWLQSGTGLQADFYKDDFIDFADYAVLAEQWLWTAGWLR